jgi:hypothetical protein
MHWRTRFLLHAARIILLPSILINSAVRLLEIDLELWQFGRLGQTRTSQFLLSVLAISSYVWLQAAWTRHQITQNASQLGARTIPIAKGKWPWNIDLLIRLTQTPRKAYVGARMYELFTEYKTNTLNIRPLGMDLVITCDHGHIKEMLATGFGTWEKGAAQREKLHEFFGKGIFGVDGKEWKFVSLNPRSMKIFS